MRLSRILATCACLPALAVSAPAAGAADEGTVSGRLLLRTDVAATLVVDGHVLGSVSPGKVLVVSLPPGRRRVALVTAGGELRWEETLDLPATQVVRLVELAAAVAGHRNEYVRIPAGSFELGCVPGDTQCADDEQPRRPLTLGSFWIMRTEVTVAAYRAAGRTLPEAPSYNEDWSRDAYPMVNVTWDDAAAYCAAVGGRLPTEAEWEYAARGGHDGWTYVWGNDLRPVVDTRKQANVADQRGAGNFDVAGGPSFPDYDDGYVYASPAFTFAPNGFELFDLAGNVREWCADAYVERDGAPRVVRGGSWHVGVTGLRVSARSALPSSERSADVGLRCARDVVVP